MVAVFVGQTVWEMLVLDSEDVLSEAGQTCEELLEYGEDEEENGGIQEDDLTGDTKWQILMIDYLIDSNMQFPVRQKKLLQMLKNNQKMKETAFSLLEDLDFSCFSKEFLRAILTYLELDESKVCHKSVIAEKIAHIYQMYRNQYDIYLTLPKFKNLSSQAKDFLWSIFKQFDERWKHRKMISTLQSKPITSRQHINSHYMIPNQNMVNMFIDVPNLQSIEEIEIFQRKMFQIYKNFMPQVMSSLHMSTSGQYYRPQSAYHSYSMNNVGSLSSISSISNMSGMPGMSIGMSGYGAINNRNNLNSVPPSLNSMYPPQKQTEYYDPPGASYSSRYFYDNKINNGYSNQQHNLQRNDKNMGNDFRPVTSTQNYLPNMGFSYYSERVQQGDEFRPGFKDMGVEEVQRKPIYSQKYYGEDGLYDNSYLVAGGSEYPLQAEMNYYRNIQKEKEFVMNNQEIYLGQQPRKMVKKDDEVSIGFQQLEERGNNKSLISIDICKKNISSSLCYHCKIVQLDPLNQVEEVLKLEVITMDIGQIKYVVNRKSLEKIGKNPQKYDIELRCIKLQKQFDNCITWPDKYRLSIDQQLIEQISQIQNPKKRKDKPFIFSKYYGNQKNFQDHVDILFQVMKSGEKTSTSSGYLFGIFVVMKKSVREMEQLILKNIQEVNIESFFNSGNKKVSKGDQNDGEAITIPIMDVSTKKIITIPVRGIQCVHPQCFDLNDYLSLLFISPCRQWKCPICGSEAKKFYIDNQVKRVLNDVKKMIKQPKQIVFYSNGVKGYKYDDEDGQGNENGLERDKDEYKERRVVGEINKQN